MEDFQNQEYLVNVIDGWPMAPTMYTAVFIWSYLLCRILPSSTWQYMAVQYSKPESMIYQGQHYDETGQDHTLCHIFYWARTIEKRQQIISLTLIFPVEFLPGR